VLGGDELALGRLRQALAGRRRATHRRSRDGRRFVDASGEKRLRELLPELSEDVPREGTRVRADALSRDAPEKLVIRVPAVVPVGEDDQVLVQARAAACEERLEVDAVGAIRLL